MLLQDNNENVVTYTPGNIESTEEIGIDFEIYTYITKKWYLYFGTSTYNYKDTGTISGSKITLDKWANFSNLTNNFYFF